jgi:hypothetical protein
MRLECSAPFERALRLEFSAPFLERSDGKPLANLFLESGPDESKRIA